MAGVTFDSNVYVSAFEFGGVCARLMGMARAGYFRVDVSDPIIDEVLMVLRAFTGADTGYTMRGSAFYRWARRSRPANRFGSFLKTQTMIASSSARSRPARTTSSRTIRTSYGSRSMRASGSSRRCSSLSGRGSGLIAAESRPYNPAAGYSCRSGWLSCIHNHQSI